MKYLIYLLTIFVLLGLNLGLFNSLQIQGQIPNLLFLLTVFFAAEKKDFDFFFIATVSGIMLDFYSTYFFGAYTLAFLGVSLLIYLLVNQFLVLDLTWRSLGLVVVASLAALQISIWFYGVVVYKLHAPVDYVPFRMFVRTFTVSLIYNLVFLYPMYLVHTLLRQVVDNLKMRRRGIVR